MLCSFARCTDSVLTVGNWGTMHCNFVQCFGFNLLFFLLLFFTLIYKKKRKILIFQEFRIESVKHTDGYFQFGLNGHYVHFILQMHL